MAYQFFFLSLSLLTPVYVLLSSPSVHGTAAVTAKTQRLLSSAYLLPSSRSFRLFSSKRLNAIEPSKATAGLPQTVDSAKEAPILNRQIGKRAIVLRVLAGTSPSPPLPVVCLRRSCDGWRNDVEEPFENRAGLLSNMPRMVEDYVEVPESSSATLTITKIKQRKNIQGRTWEADGAAIPPTK
eukprot:GHVS01097716.1.p1 GENE.GHVS01097716.1~~GHVS01097716.1.p1  ORF type:complete len:183 (-),score=32.50 GHVS01097716.1:300-848(-)